MSEKRKDIRGRSALLNSDLFGGPPSGPVKPPEPEASAETSSAVPSEAPRQSTKPVKPKTRASGNMPMDMLFEVEDDLMAISVESGRVESHYVRETKRPSVQDRGIERRRTPIKETKAPGGGSKYTAPAKSKDVSGRKAAEQQTVQTKTKLPEDELKRVKLQERKTTEEPAKSIPVKEDTSSAVPVGKPKVAEKTARGLSQPVESRDAYVKRVPKSRTTESRYKERSRQAPKIKLRTSLKETTAPERKIRPATGKIGDSKVTTRDRKDMSMDMGKDLMHSDELMSIGDKNDRQIGRIDFRSSKGHL